MYKYLANKFNNKLLSNLLSNFFLIDSSKKLNFHVENNGIICYLHIFSNYSLNWIYVNGIFLPPENYISICKNPSLPQNKTFYLKFPFISLKYIFFLISLQKFSAFVFLKNRIHFLLIGLILVSVSFVKINNDFISNNYFTSNKKPTLFSKSDQKNIIKYEEFKDKLYYLKHNAQEKSHISGIDIFSPSKFSSLKIFFPKRSFVGKRNLVMSEGVKVWQFLYENGEILKKQINPKFVCYKSDVNQKLEFYELDSNFIYASFSFPFNEINYEYCAM